MSLPLLATYGTLMKSFGRQDDLGIAGRLALMDQCSWRGDLYDLGRFPGAVPGEGTIHGELLRLSDPQVWSVLDQYEGYNPDREADSLFVRRRVSLLEPTDETAWVYWYNGDPSDYNRVPSGDWAAYVRENRQG